MRRQFSTENVKKSNHEFQELGQSANGRGVTGRTHARGSIEPVPERSLEVRRAAIGIMLAVGPFNYPLNETYATLIPALLVCTASCRVLRRKDTFERAKTASNRS